MAVLLFLKGMSAAGLAYTRVLFGELKSNIFNPPCPLMRIVFISYTNKRMPRQQKWTERVSKKQTVLLLGGEMFNALFVH